MTVAVEAPERVRLEIEGMTCASCAARIERRLNKLDGVEATVNYATDEAAVAYDPDRVAVDDLIAAVEAVGYHAALPSEIVDTEDPTRPWRRRLIVAAVLSAPLVAIAMIAAQRGSGNHMRPL